MKCEFHLAQHIPGELSRAGNAGSDETGLGRAVAIHQPVFMQMPRCTFGRLVALDGWASRQNSVRLCRKKPGANQCKQDAGDNIQQQYATPACVGGLSIQGGKAAE
jgi:hypothetical protein